MVSLSLDRSLNLSIIRSRVSLRISGGLMAMARVPRSGTVLRRLLASSTARMLSTRRSTSRVTSSHAKMRTIPSQMLTQMASLLPPKSTLPGGLMATARAPRNGMPPRRLPASPTAKKNSTNK